MRSISLTVKQLGQWLAERDVELQESFWQRLELGCREQPMFEYQFVIDQVPWRGAVRLSVSFARFSQLRLSGWSVSSPSIQSFLDDEIFVIGLVMEALVSRPYRLQHSSSWLTPHIRQSEYGVRIEYPTVKDLDAAWCTLSSLAPQVCSAAETIAIQFEQAVESGGFSMTAICE